LPRVVATSEREHPDVANRGSTKCTKWYLCHLCSKCPVRKSPSVSSVNSVQPGSSTTLTASLEFGDASQVGQTPAVAYAIIYYPGGSKQIASVPIIQRRRSLSVAIPSPLQYREHHPKMGTVGSPFFLYLLPRIYVPSYHAIRESV